MKNSNDNVLERDNTVFMQNRELSWLKFNLRVLEESNLEKTPLLEKLKFLSIFESNLTEFFMIRVGSLSDLDLLGKKNLDNKSGMSPKQQLNSIFEVLPELYQKKDLYYKNLLEEMVKSGIKRVEFKNLSKLQIKSVEEYYSNFILPVLSPQVLDSHHPFPHFENNLLYVVLKLTDKKQTKYGLVPINKTLPDYFVLTNNEKCFEYILLEDIIYNYANNIFDYYIVEEKYIVRVTRNADINLDGKEADDDEDYHDLVVKILKKRNRLSPVRLEIDQEMSSDLLSYLVKNLKLSKKQVFISKSPIKMKSAFNIVDDISLNIKSNQLLFEPYTSNKNNFFDSKNNIINEIKKQDFLLSYPYDDIDDFLNLIKQASQDPRVISIKITIYRLSKHSKLVNYLCKAAENGKEVTTLLELRARFDEENNINYSHILYEAGCNVFYGVERYKVHSKLCLITYRENGEIGYVTQVGTGNYNEFTSTMYTDFSYITSNYEIGKDANEFFRNILTAKIDGIYNHFLQAPSSLKSKILNLIDAEIKKGEDGLIMIKANSVTDYDTIQKLSEASQAGVKIYMIIRGICCILPNVEGYTENIHVRSIVGRYLEHSRIYSFGYGEDAKIYISSADLMTRNMSKRVEVATPIYDIKIKQMLIDYMKIQLNDEIDGKSLDQFGNHMESKIELPDFLQIDDLKLSSQNYFMNVDIKSISSEDLVQNAENIETKIHTNKHTREYKRDNIHELDRKNIEIESVSSDINIINEKVNIYDFDDTIYRGDSTADFYKFCLSKYPRIALLLPYQGLCFLLFLMRIMDKTKFKEKFYGFLTWISDIDATIDEFWSIKKGNIKDFYNRNKRENDIIISASPEFLLEPICKELGIRYLLASKVNRKTGKYTGENCYGEEKLRRFREAFGELEVDEFYSDSRSDAPLAGLAKKAFLVKGDILEKW